ncbi:protein of unknown function [Lysinibacillus sp. TC-37]|nr:protein of unknown function [Lysinibacillus sp. SG9]SDB11354.1 protein of unknown function [Lysinibacillus sp. TC-37]SFS48572.1 protein of unknown function [Lysinibacillus sp. SG55]
MKLRKIISLEYVIALIITVFFYGHLDFSWLYFMVFLLLPDITMIGYLLNPKIGAVFYNIGHSFISPALLLVIGFMMSSSILLMIALIWLAHIFLDRALGYGLKYEEAFQKTHLQQIT